MWGKSDMDRGLGCFRGAALFLTKNLRDPETLAPKNDRPVDS